MITNTKGRDIVSLAQELQKQAEMSRDLIVPTGRLEMDRTGRLGFDSGKETFGLNNWSSGQLATYCSIPQQYFKRVQNEDSALLSNMVNHDLRQIAHKATQNDKPEARMLRTVGPNIRAFVSSRFRRLDAYDLVQATLPIMMANKFEPKQCELTEKRVYIKAVTAKVETEVKVGDPVRFGVMFSTSDVGAGSLTLEPYIDRLVCDNGLVMESRIRQRHLGRQLATGEDITEMLSDETIDITNEAFFRQIRDVLTASMKPEIFEREVNKLRRAAELPIKNFDLEEVVELACRTVNVTGDQTKKNIIEMLAAGNQGAGLTQWGLVNSFTAAAKADHLDFDESVELERAAGEILTLTPNQWKRISETA